MGSCLLLSRGLWSDKCWSRRSGMKHTCIECFSITAFSIHVALTGLLFQVLSLPFASHAAKVSFLLFVHSTVCVWPFAHSHQRLSSPEHPRSSIWACPCPWTHCRLSHLTASFSEKRLPLCQLPPTHGPHPSIHSVTHPPFTILLRLH